MYKKYRTQLIYVFLIIGTMLSGLFCFRKVIDPDTFWHIKTGEWIFHNHKIPYHDIFSWYGIEKNFKWIAHEWLYDVFVYLQYRAGDLQLVSIVNSILGGILYLLIYKLIKIKTKNEEFSLILSMICLVGICIYIVPRPQTISYINLILVCLFMERGKWIWVIPLVILGVNVHGGFYPMYILIIMYYSIDIPKIKIKILPIVSALAVIVINPYTYEMYSYPLSVQSCSGMKLIEEWRTTQLLSSMNILPLICYLTIILMLHKIRVKHKDVVLCILVAIQTLSAQRNMVFLYLIIIPVLSPYIWEKFNERSLYISKTPVRKYDKVKLFYLMIFEFIFIVFTGTFAAYSILNIIKPQIKEYQYPKESLEYIKKNNLNNIFNIYDEGGYLILNNVKTIIDGRADIFVPIYNNTSLYDDYINVVHLKEDYENFINKYNVKYFLLPKELYFTNAVKRDSHFKKIYEDDTHIIYQYN